MNIEITKANRWTLPKFRYVNWKKEAPLASERGCWSSWLAFRKYWGGKLWYLSIRDHQIQLDFRVCPLADMVFPNATKQDRKAAKGAVNL